VWFFLGTEPTVVDVAHREITIDSRTGRPADVSTPKDRIRAQTYWTLPHEYQAWAQENGIPQPPEAVDTMAGKDEQVHENGGATPGNENEPIGEMAIRLTSPEGNRVYRLDPRLPAETQRVAITAAPGARLATDAPAVTLLLDGTPLENVEGPDYTAWWQLQAGQHTFQAVVTGSRGQRIVSEPVTVLIE
jgi:hypothetical protein